MLYLMEADEMPLFIFQRRAGTRSHPAIRNFLSFLDAFGAHSLAGMEEKKRREENKATAAGKNRKAARGPVYYYVPAVK
jgi:hypothetical protein